MHLPEPSVIDTLLPQTQCTQCGYAGCLPYAAAIAAGAAGINRCAPGGDDGIRALARLTGLPYAPLAPGHGAHRPPVLAVIDEARCIGCTICIQKCPVDAIVGAAKVMHTVIADECTGCELCVAPCPVDCIALVAMPAAHPAQVDRRAAAGIARLRHAARLARQSAARSRKRGTARTVEPCVPAPATAKPVIGSQEHKQHVIAAALARAQARRESAGTR